MQLSDESVNLGAETSAAGVRALAWMSTGGRMEVSEMVALSAALVAAIIALGSTRFP